MATQNSQKRSPRDSAKSKQETSPASEAQRDRSRHDSEDEPYLDRSLDHVARVRAAREAAERKMREFGDPSEYNVTTIRGQLKTQHSTDPAQPSFDFDRKVEG